MGSILDQLAKQQTTNKKKKWNIKNDHNCFSQWPLRASIQNCSNFGPNTELDFNLTKAKHEHTEIKIHMT